MYPLKSNQQTNQDVFIVLYDPIHFYHKFVRSHGDFSPNNRRRLQTASFQNFIQIIHCLQIFRFHLRVTELSFEGDRESVLLSIEADGTYLIPSTLQNIHVATYFYPVCVYKWQKSYLLLHCRPTSWHCVQVGKRAWDVEC